MKKSAIIRIVIYSLLALLLVGLLGSAMIVHANRSWDGLANMAGVLVLDDDDDTRSYKTPAMGEKISVNAKIIRKISVEWVRGDLTVETGDVDSIQLQESGTEEPMVYSVKGDELKVRFSKRQHGISFGRGWNPPSKDLTITVPEDWVGHELEIESVSADVYVRDLSLDEFDYSGVSGKGEIENCQVGEISMDTVSGDITFSGSIWELDCESVSADCDLTVTNVPREISMDGVSGSLKLTLPENAGFTVDIDSLSRNLDTDFAVTSKGGKFISGDGSCQISINGVSGKVEIRKAAASSAEDNHI